MTPRKKQQLRRMALYMLLVVLAGVAVWKTDWPVVGKQFFNLEIAAEMFPEIITVAVRNTIFYTMAAFAFGLVLGLLLALMKLSSIGPYRWIANSYIELFRGLPALVTLILIGFGIPIALGINIPGGTAGKATVGLGLVAAAYMAETIRAGIQAVPKGQLEAARSLGMSSTWAMVSIVIPQAFRIVIPPLTNELVLLIKDTSLVFVLGTTPQTKELTTFGRALLGQKVNGTPLTVIALMYLAITLPMTRLVAQLEKRQAKAR